MNWTQIKYYNGVQLQWEMDSKQDIKEFYQARKQTMMKSDLYQFFLFFNNDKW